MTEIHDFHGFIDKIDEFSEKFIYRGVSKSTFKLVPSIARNKPVDSISEVENQLMLSFKKQAKSYIDIEPETEIDWLSLAQHYGLPTRLLDWSTSPLVALFFAAEKDLQFDGLIYAMEVENVLVQSGKEIYDTETVDVYYPPFIADRIFAQNSRFTVHPLPDYSIEITEIHEILIPHGLKRRFIRKLNKFGINNETLFPGLDGLAKHLRWLKKV